MTASPGIYRIDSNRLVVTDNIKVKSHRIGRDRDWLGPDRVWRGIGVPATYESTGHFEQLAPKRERGNAIRALVRHIQVAT